MRLRSTQTHNSSRLIFLLWFFDNCFIETLFARFPTHFAVGGAFRLPTQSDPDYKLCTFGIIIKELNQRLCATFCMQSTEYIAQKCTIVFFESLPVGSSDSYLYAERHSFAIDSRTGYQYRYSWVVLGDMVSFLIQICFHCLCISWLFYKWCDLRLGIPVGYEL